MCLEYYRCKVIVLEYPSVKGTEKLESSVSQCQGKEVIKLHTEGKILICIRNEQECVSTDSAFWQGEG